MKRICFRSFRPVFEFVILDISLRIGSKREVGKLENLSVGVVLERMLRGAFWYQVSYRPASFSYFILYRVAREFSNVDTSRWIGLTRIFYDNGLN